MEDKVYEDVNEGVLRHVGGWQKILDVGCGTGTIGLELKNKVNEVWGLDASKKKRRVGREKARQSLPVRCLRLRQPANQRREIRRNRLRRRARTPGRAGESV